MRLHRPLACPHVHPRRHELPFDAAAAEPRVHGHVQVGSRWRPHRLAREAARCVDALNVTPQHRARAREEERRHDLDHVSRAERVEGPWPARDPADVPAVSGRKLRLVVGESDAAGGERDRRQGHPIAGLSARRREGKREAHLDARFVLGPRD
eukprot:7289647-Prymnesium_polylepis.1